MDFRDINIPPSPTLKRKDIETHNHHEPFTLTKKFKTDTELDEQTIHTIVNAANNKLSQNDDRYHDELALKLFSVDLNKIQHEKCKILYTMILEREIEYHGVKSGSTKELK